MIPSRGSTRSGAIVRGFREAARLLDVLLPCGCAVCGLAVPADGPPVCGACVSRLPAIRPPRCSRCGWTRVVRVADPGLCPECESWPASLRRTESAYRHEGVAAALVHGLKYARWTALAGLLGQSLEGPARRVVGTETPVLVPVPLARSRFRERGFNQAALLAAGLASTTGWPVASLLERRHGGPSLTGLGRSARAERSIAAYRATNTCRRFRTAGRAALLVDDVITTGATAGACVDVLAAAGVRCLGAVSYVRTPGTLELA